MKNKIREKIVASIMLSAFVVTNSLSAAVAADNYAYYQTRPALRSSAEITSLDMKSTVTIPNADSIVNLSLRDADVKQVLRMFADQAGMNIIFASGVEGEVTMDLVDITLAEALKLVVTTNKLFYDIQANTIIISSESEAFALSSKSMNIIPVKYVNAGALASFLNSNIYKQDGVNPGVSTKQIATVNPATNELIIMGTENDVIMAKKIVEQFDKKPTITTFKVNHTTPAEMASLICSSLIPSTISNGASSGGSSSGFAAGVPTGFASDESSSSSSGGGGSISIGGGQMACSTESSVSGGEFAGLPFMNLSVSYFPSLGTIQVIGGSESQIDIIRDYIANNDKKTPQAYLEVQIISLSEAGSKTFDNTWQILSKNFSFNAANGVFGNDPKFPIFFAGRGFQVLDNNYNAETDSFGVSGKLGKWSKSPQLVYTVNYMLENQKGRVLANPRILLTNGQSSTIDLTSDYVKKVTSQYLDNSSGSGSAQVQKEYEIGDDNGIKVEITPFISPDGYVTLDIKPEYKTIASKIYEKRETGAEDLVATLIQRRDLDLKGIRIKDGETLVIGGMIQETETKSVKKIPFLGDIPVLGMFFRSTGTDKSKEEMVIMITPQIIVDTEDALTDDNML